MKTWMIAAGLLFALPLTAARADQDPKTARLWKAKCQTCHGADGQGKTEEAGKRGGIPNYTDKAAQAKFTDAQATDAIRKGVAAKEAGGDPRMDAFSADKLSDDQVKALVAYVRAFAK